MEALSMIVLGVMCAITVEGLVEYVKTLGAAIASKDFYAVGLQAGALALALVICFAANLDVYAALGMTFANIPWMGIALTAVPASRGANYFSDWIGKMRDAKD